MIAAIVLFDGNFAFWARFRKLLDFLLRLIIFHTPFDSATILILSACFIFVPIGLAGNAVLVPAGSASKDGLVCTTSV